MEKENNESSISIKSCFIKYCKGKISCKNMIINENNCEYICNSKDGEIKGCLIINNKNFKIIAVHKEKKDNRNIGMLLKDIILDFIDKVKNKYHEINKKIDIFDSKNQIKITYGLFNRQKTRIFGDQFSKNNLYKFKILYNEKLYEATPIFIFNDINHIFLCNGVTVEIALTFLTNNNLNFQFLKYNRI